MKAGALVPEGIGGIVWQLAGVGASAKLQRVDDQGYPARHLGLGPRRQNSYFRQMKPTV